VPAKLFNRNLTCLFVGQLVSQMGDTMYLIALMWLVLELTGSKAAMGTVAALSHLPVLLFGLPGGVVADLCDRRKVMIAADAMRAVAVLAIPLAIVAGTANLWIVYAVTVALALGMTFFNPARDAMVPELVPHKELIRANTLVQATHYAAMLLGPAVAAALIGMLGLTALFAIDSATFVVSLLAIVLIRYTPPPGRHAGRPSAALHIREVLVAVLQDKRLRYLLLLTTINNFFIMGPAIVGTPVFVREILLGNATDYALTGSALGLGMVLGSLLIHLAGHRLGKGRLLLLGMMFDGLTYAVLYFCGSLAGLMALIAFHALGIPFIMVSRTALIQEWVAPDMRGRVFSLVSMAVVGTTAVSCGVVGILAERFPANEIFCVFGTCATACGLVGWGYRGLRES